MKLRTYLSVDHERLRTDMAVEFEKLRVELRNLATEFQKQFQAQSSNFTLALQDHYHALFSMIEESGLKTRDVSNVSIVKFSS